MLVEKVTSRIEKLCYGLDMDYIDPTQITLKVINGLYTGVTTVELDNLAAEIAATMTTRHPDYAILAARYEHFLCLAIEFLSTILTFYKGWTTALYNKLILYFC